MRIFEVDICSAQLCAGQPVELAGLQLHLHLQLKMDVHAYSIPPANLYKPVK